MPRSDGVGDRDRDDGDRALTDGGAMRGRTER